MAEIWQLPFEDHTVLVRAGAERVYLLNPAAGLLWPCAAAGGTVDACAALLVDTYGIEAEIARADAAVAVAEWRGLGLLDPEVPVAVAPLAPPVGEDLAWHHYRVGDHAFAIGLPEGPLREDLPARLAHFEADPTPDATRYTIGACAGAWHVWRDAVHVDTVDSPFGARVVLLYDALRAAYANAPWCANLHAGVIAHGGRCVVLAGASGAGKSTLSVAAARAGLECLGDDSAPIFEADGRVAAMPLATMLREGSWPLFDDLAEHFHLSEVFTRDTGRVRFLSPRAPARLEAREPAALLFVRRSAGAPPRLVALGAVEALARLGETGFWVRPERVAAERFLAWLSAVPCHELHYDTLPQGTALLREVLGA